MLWTVSLDLSYFDKRYGNRNNHHNSFSFEHSINDDNSMIVFIMSNYYFSLFYSEMETIFDTTSAEPIGLINLSSGNGAFAVLPFCACFHIFHVINHIFSPAALFAPSFGLVGRTVIFFTRTFEFCTWSCYSCFVHGIYD